MKTMTAVFAALALALALPVAAQNSPETAKIPHLGQLTKGMLTCMSPYYLENAQRAVANLIGVDQQYADRVKLDIYDIGNNKVAWLDDNGRFCFYTAQVGIMRPFGVQVVFYLDWKIPQVSARFY